MCDDILTNKYGDIPQNCITETGSTDDLDIRIFLWSSCKYIEGFASFKKLFKPCADDVNQCPIEGPDVNLGMLRGLVEGRALSLGIGSLVAPEAGSLVAPEAGSLVA